ncbi:Laccase-15 [Vitis vinifera]|uniref:Laccase-15 n=1 Tax=Vitis vinifera TaxID=29760 RepID=A0A438C415_VITVI|nr:Laccase-15 [Vitis vinifera]
MLKIRHIQANGGSWKDLSTSHNQCYLHEALFFSIAKHKMTVVGIDGSYMKPLTRDYITIYPGQTFDVLLEANQCSDHYYMGILHSIFTPSLPHFPAYNDTNASVQVMAGLRSLAVAEHPSNVPLSLSTKLIYTVSVNLFLCPNNSCAGPNGMRFSGSINNISFQSPTIDILQAYYYNISGVYGDKFPSVPPLVFNFTPDYLPLEY